MGSHLPELWFENLSTHPIFTSPPASSSSQPQTTTSVSSGRKNAFGLSSLNDSTSKNPATGDEDDEDEETEMIYDKHGDEVGQRKERVVVRGGKELIAVVGREIRLVDLKEVREGRPARYWILRNPDIDFPIHQISLNPTNKLLVLVGTKQIGVIMLPSLGSLGLTPAEGGRGVIDGKWVRCKGTKIAPEIYHSRAENRIVKSRWHPWGEHGTSLLVLTDDTILREFDTSHSSTQPLQAIPFHPSVQVPPEPSSLHTPSTASSSSQNHTQHKPKASFTAEDVASKTAVSFDLGKGDGEWGALAVWGCMKNGDVWTICPFLPEFALVPEVYIETLNLYLGSKAQQYRLQNPSSSSSSSTQPDNLSTSRQSIGFSASEHDNLGRKLAAQQKWARSLSRQIDAHKASSDGFNDNDGQGRQYAVRPPRDGRRLKRQGPYLVQPEPKELPLSEEAGWGVEGVASDIVVVADKNKNSVGRGHVAGPKTGMNVVGIAWVDGRVDLCIEAQKVEAEWEMEDNQDWAEEPLLTLVTFDSIDLEILESLESASESFTPLVCNGTTFTIDPMDSTSLFVHHVLGAHWIGFKPWKTSLSHVVQMQDADEEEQELGELWKKRSTSQCAWVVDTWSGQEGESSLVPAVGSAVLADIELGYAFMTIASDKTAAIIQLNEFDDVEETEQDDLLMAQSDKSRGRDEPIVDPSSYLGGQPCNITDKSFDAVMRKLQGSVQLGHLGGKRIDSVSEEDLKMIGNVMQGYGEAVLELKQLSGRVEGRADLQVKEVALQLQRIKDAMRKVADLRGDSSDDEDEGLLGQGTGGSVDDMKQRYERIVRTQKDLGSRLAQVQGKLINNLQPDLSDTEKAWRAEMERVAEMMKETGETPELTIRYQEIQKQFDAIKPKLQQVQRDSNSRLRARQTEVPPATTSGLEQEAKHVALVLEKLKKIRFKVEDLEGIY